MARSPGVGRVGEVDHQPRRVGEGEDPEADPPARPETEGDVAFEIAGEAQHSAMLTNLGGFGRHLYDAIVPGGLRDWVESLSAGSYIHIVENEFRIPWELVRNGGDFWGRAFVISHATWDSAFTLAPRDHPVNKVVNIIGADLPAYVAQRAETLFDTLRKVYDFELVTIRGFEDPAATSEIFSHFETADLMHFTCHGEVQNGGVYLRVVQDREDIYNVMVRAIRTKKMRSDAVVFANACVSGATALSHRQTLSFGSEFCRLGAGALIGTLDFIDDKPATIFAEQYYDALAAGRDVGSALRHAKQTSRSNGGRIGGGYFLYSLYGDPYIRMNWSTRSA